MVTFRNNNNNNRRPPFRRNEEGSKFSNNNSFKRNVPGRNNHNAAKLIEKYNEMAREALAGEDRVLSENYLQHADHFTRILNEQENYKKQKFAENKSMDISTTTVPKESAEKVEEKVEEKVVAEIKTMVKEKPEAN